VRNSRGPRPLVSRLSELQNFQVSLEHDDQPRGEREQGGGNRNGAPPRMRSGHGGANE